MKCGCRVRRLTFSKPLECVRLYFLFYLLDKITDDYFLQFLYVMGCMDECMITHVWNNISYSISMWKIYFVSHLYWIISFRNLLYKPTLYSFYILLLSLCPLYCVFKLGDIISWININISELKRQFFTRILTCGEHKVKWTLRTLCRRSRMTWTLWLFEFDLS